MERILNSNVLNHSHHIIPHTATFHKCWSVIFDVNGHAPSNARVASFASQELANQAKHLFTAQEIAIVLNGQKHSKLPTYEVEGWRFDTRYTVEEDWQPAEKIITSLAGITKLCDQQEATDMEDGIYIIAR